MSNPSALSPNSSPRRAWISITSQSIPMSGVSPAWFHLSPTTQVGGYDGGEEMVSIAGGQPPAQQAPSGGPAVSQSPVEDPGSSARVLGEAHAPQRTVPRQPSPPLPSAPSSPPPPSEGDVQKARIEVRSTCRSVMRGSHIKLAFNIFLLVSYAVGNIAFTGWVCFLLFTHFSLFSVGTLVVSMTFMIGVLVFWGNQIRSDSVNLQRDKQDVENFLDYLDRFSAEEILRVQRQLWEGVSGYWWGSRNLVEILPAPIRFC